MNISPISFGKKIPLYKCQILNERTGKYVPATFNEYDCWDKEDGESIKSAKGELSFKHHIAKNMQERYQVQTTHYRPPRHLFYSLTADNKIVGIMQVSPSEEEDNIDFIASDWKQPYKYVGQTMLACIAKGILKQSNGKNITVEIPTDEAVPFYKKIGFTEKDDIELEIQNGDVAEFLKRAEQKTKAPILDVEV